jgi:cyclic pyranopterin phosphate synthase
MKMDATPNIRMIDVGDKAVTYRQATAKGRISMKKETLQIVKKAGLPKGDAIATAHIAGLMAAKETPKLLPMCHPLLIEKVEMDFKFDEKTPAVEISATVKGSGKTGFEMEALTAVTVAALAIYDMCKSSDTSMKIQDVRLARKSGGKSGTVVLE